jgi:hypothetical protein
MSNVIPFSEWEKGVAIAQVNKFLEDHGMDSKKKIDLLDFAEYLGFGFISLIEGSDYIAQIRCNPEHRQILIHEDYLEDEFPEGNNKFLLILSYLLGYYAFVERGAEDLAKTDVCNRRTKYESEEPFKLVKTSIIYKDSLKDAVYDFDFIIEHDELEEIKSDLEMYNFACELASRDFSFKSKDGGKDFVS